jgi:hypothetical protein
MISTSHRKAKASPKSGLKLALCGAALLWWLAVPAQALVVTVDLGWGYGAGWTAANAENNLISNYHLQEGSIVQVIMYDHNTASAPGPYANDNFDMLGNYSGSPIDAEPSPEIPGNQYPGDTTAYNPLTAPAGHVIAYTTQIGAAIPNGPGASDYWYNIYAQFEILGTYDRLYIRVFGATEFPPMTVVSSYWGLGPVQNGTNIVGTWYVPPIDDTVANKTNYFEVIPEPGTMSMLALGAAGLLWGRRRRPKSAPGA